MSRKACFAVLFLAAATCCETAVAAPGEGDAKRAEIREKVLQKFDENGNGQLDPDEREAAKEAMQKRREQGVARAKPAKVQETRSVARSFLRSSTRTATASSASLSGRPQKKPGPSVGVKPY